jgi:hypothetical protein
MSDQAHWTMDLGDLAEAYNKAKDLTVNALVSDGIITKEQGDAWAERNAIIIVKNSWLGELWEKLHGKSEEKSFAIHVVSKLKGKKNEPGDGKDGTGQPEARDLARFSADEKG